LWIKDTKLGTWETVDTSQFIPSKYIVIEGVGACWRHLRIEVPANVCGNGIKDGDE
jgi:hypothetical protein